jgi:hypothetical protein
MKSRVPAIILFTLISSISAFGDASFIFQNYYPAELDAPVFDENGNRLSGAHYVAVLYGGQTPDSLRSARLGAADMPPESLTAVFNGQGGYFSTPGHVWVSDLGGYAWLQVRAWDTRLGATYDEVAGLGVGGYGRSSLFYTYGGDELPTGRPPQPLRGLESFSLVPEPGTWALLAFGAGILCWKSRRRRP